MGGVLDVQIPTFHIFTIAPDQSRREQLADEDAKLLKRCFGLLHTSNPNLSLQMRELHFGHDIDTWVDANQLPIDNGHGPQTFADLHGQITRERLVPCWPDVIDHPANIGPEIRGLGNIKSGDELILDCVNYGLVVNPVKFLTDLKRFKPMSANNKPVHRALVRAGPPVQLAGGT